MTSSDYYIRRIRGHRQPATGPDFKRGTNQLFATHQLNCVHALGKFVHIVI